MLQKLLQIMLESVPLQKSRLRSAKNVIFSLLCILVDRPMGGGLNPQTPPCVRPWPSILLPQPPHIFQILKHIHPPPQKKEKLIAKVKMKWTLMKVKFKFCPNSKHFLIILFNYFSILIKIWARKVEM